MKEALINLLKLSFEMGSSSGFRETFGLKFQTTDEFINSEDIQRYINIFTNLYEKSNTTEAEG